MNLPKILVVERDKNMQKYYSIVLHGHGEIIPALSVEDTMEAVVIHPDIAVILMTSRLASRDEPDTLGLITGLRKFRYHGPIVAMSSDASYRRRMLAAGCTHEYKKETSSQKLRHEVGPIIEQLVRRILAERTPAESGINPPVSDLKKAQ